MPTPAGLGDVRTYRVGGTDQLDSDRPPRERGPAHDAVVQIVCQGHGTLVRRQIAKFASHISPSDRVSKLAPAIRHPRPATQMSLQDPVLITNSISGAVANREQCPAIPY